MLYFTCCVVWKPCNEVEFELEKRHAALCVFGLVRPVFHHIQDRMAFLLVKVMNGLMQPTSGQTMSSREIAELTGKRHDNVMRTIRDLIDGQILTPQIEESNFEHVGNSYKCFLLNKRDSLVVVARLSPEFTAAVVDRWQELEAAQAKPPAQLTTLEILQMAMQAEQGRLQAIAERDHAIATKAQIGSKREATAMATASAASRKVIELQAELGRCKSHATIIAVQNVTGESYKWQPLKKWCKERGLKPIEVVDPRWGIVKSWPAQAWLDVHAVDINMEF